jgi:hypothetical protein
VVDMLSLKQSLGGGGLVVCLVPGGGVINFEGYTVLSCPFCNVYSFTSLINYTRALSGCDVGLPLV